MKKVLFALATSAIAGMTTSCVETNDPQGYNNIVTIDQASNAPGSYDNFANAVMSSLAGQFNYGGADNKYPYDFGYTSFFLQRDVQGNDIVPAGGLYLL